ncbi:hypothetical protein SNE35_18770 [Paucibacter sp. R3-3]|uniref:Uncharacterized protein n=1 Tax=Roseateles agri TaxID=3098619 RepID=A0ABU5DMQ4_9BURK|nr:hypothetical protein [Paucibacter sp. R3-3]MDY0746564.1 hypothetical protein [Paucibacter sp. R3-3]
MLIHNFGRPTIFGPPLAQRPFEPDDCSDLKTLHKVRGGNFCALPDGYAPCHEGFRPYRCADGQVIGVKA